MALDMTKTLANASLEELMVVAVERGAARPRADRPLWMCSSAELIQELSNRSAAMSLGIQLPDDGNQVTTWNVFKGNTASCVGLADALVDQARMRMCAKIHVADDEGHTTEEQNDGSYVDEEDDDDDEDDERQHQP